METSQHIISRLLAYIPQTHSLIKKPYQVLEPSAGSGRLARALRSARNVRVNCVELNGRNIELLLKDGFKIVGHDFLALAPYPHYDYVVAVPPYKDNVDITHIKHMYSFCKPGGSVISLTLPYWTTGMFSIQREFRQWLADKDFKLEFIEDESYVNCPKAIIVITK